MNMNSGPASPNIEDSAETLRDVLLNIVEEYGIGTEFYADFSGGDLMGAVYGELLEIGEDPDDIFEQREITAGGGWRSDEI